MVQPNFGQRWLPSPQKYSAAKFFKKRHMFMLSFARGNGLTYGCIATKKLPGRRMCRMFGQHEPRLTSCRACRSKHQSLLTRRFLNPTVGNRIWAPAMTVAVWSGGSPHGFWADSRRLHKGYVNPLNEILQNLFFFFFCHGNSDISKSSGCASLFAGRQNITVTASSSDLGLPIFSPEVHKSQGPLDLWRM